MRSIIAAALLSFCLVGAAGAQDKPAEKPQETIVVFAAASLKNVIDDVNAAFTAKTNIKTTTSYAATSALIKQIEQGAPADVFISADLEWMDYGEQKKLLTPGTRFELAGNKLVLIAPKNSKQEPVMIGANFDLAKLAGDGRIATGDVRAVPVGKYAKAALEKLGAWEKAEPKFAMSDNVRAALTLVSREEASLGIVYETDAKIEPGVKIIGVFPPDSYPPVIYPAALTATGKAAPGKSYLDFLRSATAQVLFERYGFTFLVKAGP